MGLKDEAGVSTEILRKPSHKYKFEPRIVKSERENFMVAFPRIVYWYLLVESSFHRFSSVIRRPLLVVDEIMKVVVVVYVAFLWQKRNGVHHSMPFASTCAKNFGLKKPNDALEMCSYLLYCISFHTVCSYVHTVVRRTKGQTKAERSSISLDLIGSFRRRQWC